MRVLGAYAYYLVATLRNRVLALGRKLKSPRHLIGLILAAVYIGFLFVRPLLRSSAALPEETGAGGITFGITAFFWMQFIGAWIFGAFSNGIAFREAEVQLLFPAPLRRDHILLFKWLQSQLGILVLALFCGVGAWRAAGANPVYAIVGIYAVANVMTLHSTWVNLLMLRLKQRGWNSMLLVIPGVLMLALCAAAVFDGRPASGGGLEWLKNLGDSPAVAAYFAPFRWLASPAFAVDFVSFASKLAIPLLTILFVARLVIRADVAFEDQAAEGASRIERARAEGVDALARPDKHIIAADYRPPFGLKPTGPAWVAFVWKNAVSIGRINRRSWLFVLFIVFVVTASLIFTTQRANADVTSLVGVMLMIAVFYSAIFGASLIRVDLRLDIPHFDVIRVLPIRGRDLIFGEVVATTLTLFLIQCFLCTIAVVLLRDFGEHSVSVADRVMYGAGALIGLLGLDFVLVTAENLMALFFPSFVRLGRGARTGIDNMGQQLIGAILRLFAWFLLVLVPGGITAVVAFALYAGMNHVGATAIVAALVFSGLLIGESLLLMTLSERRYDTFDLSAEHLSVE